MEEEIKEMESTIEREEEEHKDLMRDKEKEYIETEEQLTADNQEISRYFCHTVCTSSSLQGQL